MTEKKKFIVYAAVIVSVFIYVALSEVMERWVELFQISKDLSKKEQMISDPAELGLKRTALVEKKTILAAAIIKSGGKYEQSQSGILEFLNESARINDIRVESLIPIEPAPAHQIRDIGFKVSFSAPFHRIGAFLNALENGTLTIRMRRLELTIQSRGSSTLNVNAEGAAYILPKKYFE